MLTIKNYPFMSFGLILVSKDSSPFNIVVQLLKCYGRKIAKINCKKTKRVVFIFYQKQNSIKICRLLIIDTRMTLKILLKLSKNIMQISISIHTKSHL